MLNRIIPNLTKIPGSRGLWRRFPFGSTPPRICYGIFSRPQYAYGVCATADLAQGIKIDKISAVELAVAGGRALEAIAKEVSRALNIRISLYGFDTGNGMPASIDYRDFPYVWVRAFTGWTKLRFAASLKHAQLILGDVSETDCLH
jgi:hypothetical protein